MTDSAQIIDDAIAANRALPGALLPVLHAIQDEIRSIHAASGLPRILGIKMPCASMSNAPDQRCAAFICTSSGYKNGGTAISYEQASPTTFVVTGVACRP